LEKTNKRLPLNLEDSTRHECAGFYAVNNRAALGQSKQLFFGKWSLYYKCWQIECGF